MKVLVIIVGLMSSTLSFSQDSIYYPQIERAANKVGVPAELLAAICWSESKHTPETIAFGDGGKFNHAFGLCQVLLNTAKDLGFQDTDDNCLKIDRTSKRTYETCKLFGPYTNAYWAAVYLKQQLTRYDSSWSSAIAAYNSGSVKNCPKKGFFWISWLGKLGVMRKRKAKCDPGSLMNQEYVDRVLKALSHKSKTSDKIEDVGK